MRFVICLSLIFFHAFLSADDDQIYVELSSEVEMLPIFMGNIQLQETSVTREYADAVRQVLVFDLNHNGATRVLTAKETGPLHSLKDQNSYDSDLDFTKLKADGILYLIKMKIKGSELVARVISVNSQTGNTIDHIGLTGTLGKDRVKIHQLADTIHKLLFGKAGIATCRILYTIKNKIERPKQEPKWIAEVYVADYDGQNVRQLTHDQTLCANPIFVPPPDDKPVSSFIYVSYKIGQPKIYLASLYNDTISRVSPLRSNQVTPAVNSNGTAIAFACDVTGRADIFLQPLVKGDDDSPTARQIFTGKGVANASPTFSPDGKKIAFVSDKDGAPKIYLMPIPAPGTKLSDIKPQLISKRNRENSAPSWSPDGKKLAYCARNGGTRQIWIYDFETGLERQLTKGSANKENPAWASDSLHLLFNATDSSGTDLYLINLNQREATKITSGPGAKQFPSWEPKAL